MTKLLLWARNLPFPRSHQLRPTFPQWLDQQDLASGYCEKTCAICRRFLTWIRTRYADRYDALPPDWIEGLQPLTGLDELKERQLYTVDEVRTLVDFVPQHLIEERDRAAVAMLFLSGMRNRAFCTLPIRAVHLDINTGMIQQWPKLGVRTKGGKAANTWLLDIPDLRGIVSDWDRRVRKELPVTMTWFPNTLPQEDSFDPNPPGKHRSFNDRLEWLCERAGLTYKSTHKLHHGHVVWALERCTTMADVEAVSENVMHSNITTTISIYGRPLEKDVGHRIGNLTDTTVKIHIAH